MYCTFISLCSPVIKERTLQVDGHAHHYHHLVHCAVLSGQNVRQRRAVGRRCVHLAHLVTIVVRHAEKVLRQTTHKQLIRTQAIAVGDVGAPVREEVEQPEQPDNEDGPGRLLEAIQGTLLIARLQIQPYIQQRAAVQPRRS
jgi:hypothetical protein